MPKINESLFRIFYAAAQRVVRDIPSEYRAVLPAGTELSRFTAYRNDRPQAPEAASTVFLPLAQDRNNRFSGMGADGVGRQALYLSLLDGAPTLGEVDYYMDAAARPSQILHYYKFDADGRGVWDSAPVAQCNSLFGFMTIADVAALNVIYTQDPASPVNRVFDEAKRREPRLVTGTASDHYFSNSDTSFCRALGIAGMEVFPSLVATSVRDRNAVNHIVRSEPGKPSQYLKVLFRATRLIDSDGIRRLVWSMNDLTFNDRVAGEFKFRGVDLNTNYKMYAEDAAKISKFIPWDFVEGRIEEHIGEQTMAALLEMAEPFSRTVDALVHEIADRKLNLATHKTLTEATVASAHLWPEYGDLSARIGADSIDGLVRCELVEPKFEKISNGSNGASYIELSVRQVVLEQQALYLSESAADIQRQQAEATKDVKSTEAEIATQNEALREIERQIAQDQDNSKLVDQKGEIERELKDLEDANRRAQERQRDVELEHKRIEEERRESDRDARDTGKELHRAAESMIHGI